MNKPPWISKGVWYWTPVVLYAGLIVFLSSQSTPLVKVPLWYEGVDDKIMHAMEYAILAVLFYRAYSQASGPTVSSIAPLLALLSAALFGLTDEIHQYFVPNRIADGWDFLADVIGASVGVHVWQYYDTRIATRSSS